MKTKYHNPERVPHNKIPRGWRFLTHEESAQRCRGEGMFIDLRVWLVDANKFTDGADYVGNIPEYTYIIRK